MGVLDGLRVVELAGFGPAPFCAMLLADMGADVVRIERANAPERGIPIEHRFEVMNRGRRSVELDLKTPEGRDTLLQLAARADVLIEGYRPGVMERLGVGPEDCMGLNAALVYGRVTGYGQDGPLAQAAGHDINFIAVSGVLNTIGPANGPPVPPLNLVADYGGGGMLLALGVLAACLEARRSGQGQVVDAAMLDGSALLMAGTLGLQAAGLWQERRGSNVLDGGAPWYGVYETSDGRHLALGAVEPRFYAQLTECLGFDREELAPRADRTRWGELRTAFASRISQRTQAEWEAIFLGTDACASAVLSSREAAVHPHVVARGSLITVQGVLQPAPAPRFSRTPSELRRPPPESGAHTEEVLREWGLTDSGKSATE